MVSCRDPNGAHQVRELLRSPGPLQFIVVADEPAYSMLRADGCDVRLAGVECVRAGDALGKQRSIARATELLREIEPGAILVSSSGPEAGLDEALVAAAKPGHRYVMQDFWGDVNESLGVLADCYFVLDEHAAALTGRRTGARTVATGMPKFAAYRNMNFTKVRTDTRTELKLSPGAIVVTLVAQPLWHTAGYVEAMRAIIDVARALEGEKLLLVRPHPSDRSERIGDLSRHAEACGVPWTAATGFSTDAVIAASDIVCSAFSSCCYDVAVMSSRSLEPLGVPIYVLPEEVWQTFREYSRLDSVPPVDAGIALSARSASELKSLFERAVQPDIRRDIWQRCRAHPTMAGDAARQIVTVVHNEIASAAA